jgi:hypothetical protein
MIDDYPADRPIPSVPCRRTALVLAVMHLLALAGGFYQTKWVIEATWPALPINGSIWLAPAVLVLLCRNQCVLVVLCAVPIVVNFSARMYYLWDYYWFGVNSMSRQKGDWAAWFEILMGTVSAPIVALWLLVYPIYLIARALSGRIQREQP